MMMMMMGGLVGDVAREERERKDEFRGGEWKERKGQGEEGADRKDLDKAIWVITAPFFFFFFLRQLDFLHIERQTIYGTTMTIIQMALIKAV